MLPSVTQQTTSTYTQVVRQLAGGYLVLDAQQKVTAVNETAAALFSQTPAQLIGRTWADLPAAEQRQTWPDIAALARARMVPMHDTLVTLTAVDLTGSTLVTFTPQPQQERLSEALALTQRLAGIGLLTASVSHELNNPISIITTACGNLQMEFDGQSLGEERLARYLEMIETSAWRCARILNVLRHYSHEDEPQMAVTDLNMIIKDALTLLQHQFRLQYKIEVETDLTTELKSIVCDHNRVTQVVINLLTNARDAMQPQGGTIRIQTWSEPGDIPNGKGPRRDWMGFSIADSGPGLSDEVMAHLYTPFSSTKANGSGLGLFISHQIVAEHNGRIHAENLPGGGARFTVLLPRQP